jgi:hypothetical protein
MNEVKLIFSVVLTCFALSAGFASDIYLPTFAPVTPEVKAQGGAFQAVSKGYNSLFVNPAGFAVERWSLTATTLNPTFNVSPSSLNPIVSNLSVLMSGNIPSIASALNTIITSDGIGGEGGVGIGWVGGGLGLGLVTQASAYTKGASLLGAIVTADVTQCAVIGYALNIPVNEFKIKVGLDVRPMQRTYGTFGLSDATKAMTGAVSLYNGFAMAFDIGTLAEWGPFSVGMTIRDLGGTKYTMKSYLASNILAAFNLPSTGGTAVSGDSFLTAMSINPGFSYTPEMGTLGSLLQPRLQADFSIPLLMSITAPSLLASSHFGGEVKLLSFLSVRAGLNQGWFTAGIGAHLLFLDVNIAVYSDELGQFTGKSRKPGVAADVAVRF